MERNLIKKIELKLKLLDLYLKGVDIFNSIDTDEEIEVIDMLEDFEDFLNEIHKDIENLG